MTLKYRSLSRRIGEIRLLKIIDSEEENKESSVRYTLEYESLHGLPEFFALSYPWGSSEDPENIVIDDYTHEVTQNLASALKRLREIGVKRVWVDALCINQEDGQEKDDQVPRMEAIYRCAKVTYAWLPVQEDDVQEIQRWSPDSESQEENMYEAKFRSIHIFFDNEYWRRMWVLQETALSSNIKVLYGPAQFDFDKVSALLKSVSSHAVQQTASTSSGLASEERPPLKSPCNSFQRRKRTQDLESASGGRELQPLSILPESTPEMIAASQHIRNIIDLRHETQSMAAIRLIKVLEIARESHATEILDRVYGLWGLATNGRFYLPELSYSYNTFDVSIRLTSAHIPISSSLDILPVLAITKPNDKLPSWAPDWFDPDTWATIQNHEQLCNWSPSGWTIRPFSAVQDTAKTTFEGKTKFSKPQPWSAHGSTLPQCSFDGKNPWLLKARGVILGTIVSCSTDIEDELPLNLPENLSGTPTGFATSSSSCPRTINRRWLWNGMYFLLSLHTSLFEPDRNVSIYERFLYKRLFQNCCKQIPDSWWRQNSRAQIFDTDLASAMKQPTFYAPMKVILVWVVFPVMTPLLALMFLMLFYSYPFGDISVAAAVFCAVFCLILLVLLGIGSKTVRGISRYLKLVGQSKSPQAFLILKLGMRLAWGEFGIGWIHRNAQPGDSIVILMGCRMPLIIRKRAEEGGWVLVGDAVVYGAMKGQMMNEDKCETIELY